MSTLPTFTTLGAGPTVLMLHGIGGGHLSFAPQVESFASSGYRAVAWDMPGYGHSAPIEPYTFKGLAERCITLIESLRCDQVVLVGHSMGGMVAQEVVARRPGLVSRLVLCGTSASFGKPDGEWQREFIAQRTAPLDAGQTMAQLAEQLVPQMVGPGSLPEGVRLAQHCMSQVNPSTYRRALEALVTFDRRANLGNIHVPTLLICGDHDESNPSLSRTMHEKIAGSELVTIPGAAHLSSMEKPSEVTEAIARFLNAR